MSERDAEQRVREWLDTPAINVLTPDRIKTDLRDVLRQLDEARSELGKLTTQYGACLYPGGPILLINADEIEPYRASGHYRIEQRVVGPWLPDAAEPQQQPHHGPHKGQRDDTDAAATPGKTRQENGSQGRAEDQDET